MSFASAGSPTLGDSAAAGAMSAAEARIVDARSAIECAPRLKQAIVTSQCRPLCLRKRASADAYPGGIIVLGSAAGKPPCDDAAESGIRQRNDDEKKIRPRCGD